MQTFTQVQLHRERVKQADLLVWLDECIRGWRHEARRAGPDTLAEHDAKLRIEVFQEVRRVLTGEYLPEPE
jgi:hypothetical protein